MNRPFSVDPPRGRSGLWLVAAVLAAITAWVYMTRIVLPWEHYVNVEAGTMKATLGDLYSPWYGTQALLREGKNPYGREVTGEIQTAFYGHAVVQQAGTKVIDEQRFAYPVYVVFLLAPAAKMGFETAQTWVPLILALAVAGSVVIWMSVLRWRLSLILAAALVLFFLASPQIAQGFRLRQLGFVVALLLALAAFLIQRNHVILAGVIVAVATIKPQMIILPFAWFAVWTFGDLRRRWKFLAGFLVSLALLVGAGQWILPGWLRDFAAGLVAYRKYGPVTTPLQLVCGDTAGMLLGAVTVAGVLVWGWKNRKCDAGSSEFVWTLSGFLMGAAVALPQLPPFNQVLLILPTLILVRDWSRLPRAGRAVFAMCVGWPWITSLILLAARINLKSTRAVPLVPSALVLLLPFLLPALLMVRRASGMNRPSHPA